MEPSVGEKSGNWHAPVNQGPTEHPLKHIPARFTTGPSHTKLVAHVAWGSRDRQIDAKRGSA